MKSKDETKSPKPARVTSASILDDQLPVAKKGKAAAGKNQEIISRARFLKVSPKKVKLVIDAIRGLRALEALDRLHYINKAATLLVIKLINSALANAEHNFQYKKEDLYIKKIVANSGPTLHRWQARAFGRAAGISRRTTHLELVLSSAKPLPTKKVKRSESTVKPDLRKKSDRPKDRSKKGETKKESII